MTKPVSLRVRSAGATILWGFLVGACAHGESVAPESVAPGDAPPVPEVPLPPFDPSTLPSYDAVYAQTGNRLYRIDPATAEPTQIGMMVGVSGGSVTDLAINKAQEMFAVTEKGLYRLDPKTAAARPLRDLPEASWGHTSLSFVPVDLENPQGAERLVTANTDGDVLELDTTTGVSTSLGNYGKHRGKQISSSGDIVAIYGAGIFATVNVEGDNGTDYLAKINPQTWQATIIGDLKIDSVFGLGYWRNKLYGFARNGTLLVIKPQTAEVLSRADGALEWFGAGVTTLAPIAE